MPPETELRSNKLHNKTVNTCRNRCAIATQASDTADVLVKAVPTPVLEVPPLYSNAAFSAFRRAVLNASTKHSPRLQKAFSGEQFHSHDNTRQIARLIATKNGLSRTCHHFYVYSLLPLTFAKFVNPAALTHDILAGTYFNPSRAWQPLSRCQRASQTLL